MTLALAAGAGSTTGRRPTPAKIVWGALVALVFGVVAAVLAPAATAHAAPTDEAREIIALTNEQRAGAGAPPVQHSDAVQVVAQDWAEHLAAEDNGISHNPSFADQVPSGWSGVAENVASGGTSPQAFHDMWVGSEGHFRNLMNPAYNVMGVGYATSSTGVIFAVEVFATYDEITDALGAVPIDAATNEEPAPAPEAEETVAPDTTTPEAEATEAVDATEDATPVATEESTSVTTPLDTSSPTATTAEAGTTPNSSNGGLANTGTDNFSLLALGASLALLLGAAVLIVTQQRRRRRA